MEVVKPLQEGVSQLALESFLSGFRLREDELAVCLAARGKFRTAREIAEILQASRPDIFDLLLHLSKADLIKQSFEDGVRRFRFCSKSELGDLLFEKQLEIEQLQEQLTRVSNFTDLESDERLVWPTRM